MKENICHIPTHQWMCGRLCLPPPTGGLYFQLKRWIMEDGPTVEGEC